MSNKNNFLSRCNIIQNIPFTGISTKQLDDMNRKYFDDKIDNKTINITNKSNKPNNLPNNPKMQDSYYNRLFYTWIPEDPMIDDVSTIFYTKTDPLSIFILSFASIFIYIYFVSELICQVIGLFYPVYYLYTLLNNDDTDHFVGKIQSVIKYFIIYAHLECMTMVTKLFGFYFFHLKILMIISVLYMTGYQEHWLQKIYDRIIFYDKILLGLFNTSVVKIQDEYSKANNEAKKSEKSEKSEKNENK